MPLHGKILKKGPAEKSASCPILPNTVGFLWLYGFPPVGTNREQSLLDL
jgi:hypothetical protein